MFLNVFSIAGSHSFGVGYDTCVNVAWIGSYTKLLLETALNQRSGVQLSIASWLNTLSVKGKIRMLIMQ